MEAIIFDMDGLLVDSEPLWDQATIAVFDALGIRYDWDYFQETMGMRVDLIMADWYRRAPWGGPSPTEVTAQIVERVAVLIRAQAQPKPGALETVAFFRERAIPMAVASSSPNVVIEANITALGIGGDLQAVSSAADEQYGKPHPAVYIRTAAKLGVPPQRCLVFEDAILGVVAAKSAETTCICVPDPAIAADRRLGIADYVLPSLNDFDEALWQEIAGLN